MRDPVEARFVGGPWDGEVRAVNPVANEVVAAADDGPVTYVRVIGFGDEADTFCVQGASGAVRAVEALAGGDLPAVAPTKLTVAVMVYLRRPFATVKFMPNQRTPFDGKVRCLAYIDSSLAVERIAEVDPEWTGDVKRLGATYAEWKAERFPTEYRLTVLGVTKMDLGMGSSQDPIKGAYSDALKRAALRFGVGAYLRDSGWEFSLPVKVKDRHGTVHESVSMKKDGNIVGLTAAGKSWLQAEYRLRLTRPEFVRHYGDPVEYGDIEDEQDDAPPPEQIAESTGMSASEVDVLVYLGGFNGKLSDDARRTRISALSGAEYEAEVNRTLLAVSRRLEMPAASRDEVKRAAIDHRESFEEFEAIAKPILEPVGDANAS